MTEPSILRAANRTATPWKNGLGVTREIAAHPPGAGLDDFDWRISMAAVDAGGPFSSFPDVDRKLTVLEGRLSLNVDGRTPIELGPGSPPLAFPGDVPVDAEVLAGPVIDLNVMTRRGEFAAQVEPLTVDDATTIVALSTTIILVRTNEVELALQDRRVTLACDDAVLFDEGFEIKIEPSQPSRLFVIRLVPD